MKHLPTSPLDLLQKAIYLFQKTSYSPCGAFLFRTKPIFALNACAEQQALVSTTYQVENTFQTRSDTNVECLSLRYNPNKSYACVLVNRAAMGRRGSCFTRGFFFSVVLSVTRPKLLSATLRMTQLMVFIRVKNILKSYGGRMG